MIKLLLEELNIGDNIMLLITQNLCRLLKLMSELENSLKLTQMVMQETGLKMLFNKESELIQILPTTVKLLPIQVTEEAKLKVQLLLKNLIWFKLVKELITLLMFMINSETLLEFLQPV
jgi:hypothetical protein